MSPSLWLDNTSDLPLRTKSLSPNLRTLLLAPPSLAAHEEALRNTLSEYDRTVTELQMLDRVSTGFVTLPPETYDLIMILSDPDGSGSESRHLLDRKNFQRIFQSLKGGGKLRAQNRSLTKDSTSSEFREAILSGLVLENSEFVKPKDSAINVVPIKLLRSKDKNISDSLKLTTSGVTVQSSNPASAFLKNSHLRHDGNSHVAENNHNGKLLLADDDELIDEDTLLTEEEMYRPLRIPAECAPRVGKRRRACKDCTCGLAEKIAAEDAAKRSTADAQLRALKLNTDELTEVDFTIFGKIGSCGNCSLGDAFRCDGCPYIGMPAFKPGEEVRLLNNDIQL